MQENEISEIIISAAIELHMDLPVESKVFIETKNMESTELQIYLNLNLLLSSSALNSPFFKDKFGLV